MADSRALTRGRPPHLDDSTALARWATIHGKHWIEVHIDHSGDPWWCSDNGGGCLGKGLDPVELIAIGERKVSTHRAIDDIHMHRDRTT